MTAAHDTRAAAEVEQRRLRAKVDDLADIATIVFGPAVVELEADEAQRPRRGLPVDPVDEGNALVRAFDRVDFGNSDDDQPDRPMGHHRGELSLWVGDGHDVGDSPQYERVYWSDDHAHGEHRVITLEEWRERWVTDKDGRPKLVRRNPNPSQWCAVFAAERVKQTVHIEPIPDRKRPATYIGCHRPLDLDWPERQCEFPNAAPMWQGELGRPERCHCNGCMPRPRGYGSKYCCDQHKLAQKNAVRREQRRREGKHGRGLRSELDRAADKRARKLAV